ncbi:DUF455 domain-containing protein [Chloropicon primus]|uniref:DUF455 domain-containing protein n=1 Tax=Chloropicon primus TaxID=1764295 RepID=A0A5B8MPL5_9CHLO|nr:DUF455 domain-containing protein [Chloropicon primus]UPR01668.1 DUF455 domain-containing protein [Chloropicon primus]|eukprot:QDZ22449.1 DUF455 domain-containing protein [Chloropicon primus]
MAICHSLAHIESWAIDLSWDIIARFGISQSMPFGFVCDFARVALDEASHFERLAERLKAMGGSYGDFPAHDGLWESAVETSESLMARLAIEHMVHEARGLDVLPQTISKFENGGDKETALVLRNFVYPEEVTHCAAGLKYYCYLYVRDHAPKQDGKDTCLRELEGLAIDSMGGTQAGDILSKFGFNVDEVIASFHSTVRKHFHGRLKPPFNDEAREKAGFTKTWYEPLATK